MPASETIPEDVWAAAGIALETAWLGSNPKAYKTAIARAILSERARATAAERERCARVADDYQVSASSIEGAVVGAETARFIAAAIRSGDHYAS